MAEKEDERRPPVPDPTTLTTEALRHDLHALRELLEAKIKGNNDVLTERVNANAERLERIELQRIEHKKDTKDGVESALKAQNEFNREQNAASERAIAKSETAIAKQMDQMGINFRTEMNALCGNVSDVKDRVGKIENVKQGGQQAYTGLYMLVGFILMFVTIVGTIIGLVIAYKK